MGERWCRPLPREDAEDNINRAFPMSGLRRWRKLWNLRVKYLFGFATELAW